MKKTLFLLTSVLIIMISLFYCKKEPINIILHDKSLPIIQQYIHGNWRLFYAKGGICSTCKFPCQNCTVEFTYNNKIISNSFFVTTDTTSIQWRKDVGMYLNGDSTYIMSFLDEKGGPWQFVIDQIYNDTLIFHDNADDPVFYYNIKNR